MNRKSVLFLTLALTAGMAFANGVSTVNAPMKEWIDTGNSANGLLCATVGDVGGTGLFGNCGSAPNALHSLLKVFNLAVFGMASIFMTWNVLSGTMSSAHDGEFLGKRNNGTWAPIRVVIGGLSIVPAFGGFNLAQLVMIWATAVGVGIAGAGASGAITQLQTFSNTYSAPATVITGREVVAAVAEKATCIGQWTSAVKKWADDGTLDPDASNLQWGMTSTSVDSNGKTLLVLQFGEMSGHGGYHADDCGSIAFPLPNPSSVTDPGMQGILSAVASTMLSGIPSLVNTVQSESARVGQGMVQNEDDLATSMTNVNMAAAAFDNAMQNAVQSAVSNANTTVTNLSVAKGNWVGLGFSDAMAVAAGAMTAKEAGTSTISSPSRVSAPQGFASDKWMKTAWGSLADGAKTVGTMVWDGLAGNAKIVWNGITATAGAVGRVGSAFLDENTKVSDAIGNEISGAVGYLKDQFNKMMYQMTSDLALVVKSKLMEAGGKSPLTALIQLGLGIVAKVGATLMIFLGITIALVAVSYPVPGVSGVISFLGFVVTAVCIPLLFFGVRLAAYLPFLPAVIWCGAVLNWLVIVIEALFGAPLWALAHLDLEGEGLNMQRTGHGYMFLLNLMFRPIMMVGALIFAKSAMATIFGLFVGGVVGVLNHQSSDAADWLSFLMLVIGAVWITVAFAEQIVTQSMSLIFQIPDKVFAWIGGHFGSNVGADMERGVGHGVEQMSGGAASATTQSGQFGAKAAGDAASYNSKEARAERSYRKEQRSREQAAWKEADSGGGNKIAPASGGGGG